MSESATVHCFSVVRALSSLNLEVWKAGYIEECHCPLFLILGPAGFEFVGMVWNSLLIKAFIGGLEFSPD
ncbi:unnamed protein product [Rodentolepis nana]|uniref:Ovule protein n=1 Tax=Rodentolepis nana TaxID=102285 RepID=A0A0R3T7F4_RODNA|nr:unnamed protein product [Rodentolepis nana]